MIDLTSGVWTSLGSDQPTTANAVQPHFGPLCSTQDWPDKSITEIQGCEAIQTADLHKPTNGADRLDVRHMGPADMRIASFHIAAFAWRNACADVCHKWTLFLSYCLSHQVDFIMGDGNLFFQRIFTQDRHSDFWSCLYLD